MIDLTDFKPLLGTDAWIRRSDPEVIIGGHADAPLPGRLAVADIILADIDGLLAKGTAYLDHFVDRARFAANGNWHLEALEFGRTGDEPISEFAAFFSLPQDVYGMWSVVFRHDNNFGALGVGFSRRQR